MTNKLPILIVDDEEDILDILDIHLSALGWDVTTVEDPRKVPALLREQTYFLLISDIAMPHLSGDELIDQVHKEFPAVQLAIMTGFGYDPSHSLVTIHKEFNCPILLKPFNFKEKRIEETVELLWNNYQEGAYNAL